jgi:predicted  nucleic acid-binding Zn-ribbon protein
MHQLNLLSALGKIDAQIITLKKKEFKPPEDKTFSATGNKAELLSQLIRDREDLVGRIDERLRQAIEKLQLRYNKGTAISKIIDNSCSSCNIGVSSLSINAIKNRGELTFCEHCGRILVYEKD